MFRHRLRASQCTRWLSVIVVLAATTAAQYGLAQEPDAAVVPVDPVEEKVHALIEDILESEVELRVPLRRSKIVRMRQDIFRVAIADPTHVEVVAFGAREIEIIGKNTGSTTVTLWLGHPGAPELLSILVTVTTDPAVDERRRLEIGELQLMINEMFPDSKVQLIPIADKLIVRGQARDEQDAVHIMSIIRKNLAVPDGAGGGGFGAQVGQGALADVFPDAGDLPESHIVSLLKVPGEKQVMLKVRIAELKRSAARRLGVDFDFQIDDLFISSFLGNLGNIVATQTFDESSFSLFLEALATNGSAKILAEPNLVVLSGESANFLAGGQFPVPTVVGVDGVGAATTTFQAFGTQLAFTPTILDHDRIRLKVAPTFSTVNRANSVNGVFGLDTRSVNTTVDLREGQVLAIAGLLQDQQAGDETRVPWLGDMKLLKPFFSRKSITRSETELIILVSPELVHPLEPEYAPTVLPGMEVTEPDDIDFFLHGYIEGRPGVHYRSTVWPLYKSRLKDCRIEFEEYGPSEKFYINGPSGFSQ